MDTLHMHAERARYRQRRWTLFFAQRKELPKDLPKAMGAPSWYDMIGLGRSV